MAQQAAEWWSSLNYRPQPQPRWTPPPSWTPPAPAPELQQAMFLRMVEKPPPKKPEPKPAEPKATKAPTLYPGGTDFVRGMVKRGWKAEEAAGAAGNVHVESGFRPEVKSSVPKEQSYGFLQWNRNRLQGLKNMAESTQRDWTDPEVQMDWIDMERTGESVKYGGEDERRSYRRAFEEGGSPADIAERFGRFVERPKSLADTVDTRRLAAEEYMRTFV